MLAVEAAVHNSRRTPTISNAILLSRREHMQNTFPDTDSTTKKEKTDHTIMKMAHVLPLQCTAQELFAVCKL